MDIGTAKLTVAKKLSALGTIYGGSGGKIVLSGTGTFSGTMPPVDVHGSWSTSATTRVGGDLTIADSALLAPSGQHLTIDGNLSDPANGALSMTVVSDTVEVKGAASFVQTDGSIPSFTAGVLLVRGDFTVADGGSGHAGFKGNGTHTVVLNGTTGQTVDVAYGADGTQQFQNLVIADSVRFAHETWIAGNATLASGKAVGADTVHVGGSLSDQVGGRWAPAFTKLFG
jgi:hypothetical protein